MTFLTPIPALIAAAITLPLLLALYLLKLRRRPLRVGSTLFWPKASEDAQVNVPLRWLRPSWLLLLHLLALACLLLAFARPALDAGGDGAGQRVVLLIDTSASMGAIDASPQTAGGGEQERALSRLDRAKERAKELASQLRSQEGRRVAVVSFAGSAQPLSGFTGSAGLLHAAIQSAEQTDQAGNLEAALTFVESLLASGAEASEAGGAAEGGDGGAGGLAPATVVLLSDGSFEGSGQSAEDLAFSRSEDGANSGGASGEDAEVEGTQPVRASVLATSLRVRLERIGPPLPAADEPQATPRASNVGVASFAARRDEVNPALVRVFARLVNSSTQAVDVPLTLAIEGTTFARRAVRVGPATSSESGPVGIDRPGVEQVLFEVPTSPRGVLTLAIDREDALASDNVASLTLPELFRPRIVVVSPEGDGPSQQVAGQAGGPNLTQAGFAWLVTDVLEELSSREVRQVGLLAWEGNGANNAPRGTQTTDAPDAPNTSDAPDAIDATPTRAQGVGEGGEGGEGDLVVFLGGARPELPSRVPSLSFASEGGLSVFAQEAGASSPGTITPRPGSIFWERSHPLMAGVPLDSLLVRTTRAWNLPSDARGVEVLARSDDTPLIALVRRDGVEHVVVGFDLVDSNWPLQASFAVFLANVVDRLTPRASSFVGSSFSTNQVARVRASGDARVTLEGPVSVTVREASTPVAGGSSASGGSSRALQILSAGVLPRAGLYIARGTNPSAGGDRAVAVNVLSTTESMTLAPAEVRLGSRPLADVTPVRVPRELWRYFLIAALVLLAIEWLIYARQVRA